MTTLLNGEVIANRELDILSADAGFQGYVCEDGAETIFANVHPDDQHLLYEMVETLSLQDKVSLCFRLCTKSGDYRWVNASCSNGKNDTITIDFRDINELEDGVRAIEIDYLTGLYNKKAITEYVKKEIDNNPHKVLNLCIVDIDNFKQINDILGHAYGDKILKEVADIILKVLGKDGVAGRIGGDELLMTIENVEERTDLRVYLKAIRERVEASHMDENGFPQVTVSMGIATFPLYVKSYDELFNLADRMLRRAKSRGKNRYVIYNPDIHGPLKDGELDDSAIVVNRATAVDKTKLVLESLEGLFGSMNEAIPSLLMKIAATYELDEVYIFYKDLSKCYNGFKRVSDSGNNTDKKVYQIVDSESDISYAKETAFDAMFNSNGVLVLDTPITQLKHTTEALEFFKAREIKHAFIYKMESMTGEGYLAFYNTRNLSRKLPQPDITDLTYLSKMLEIALKTR